MAEPNTLAYYNMASVTAIEFFTAQAPWQYVAFKKEQYSSNLKTYKLKMYFCRVLWA